VDSKRTKKKMDLGAGPNAGHTNPGPMAPLAIEAHRGTPRRGRLR
jgi:hypothetical protein